MVRIATLGPKGSDGFHAALQYAPEATVLLFNRISEIVDAFSSNSADYAIIPVYNTREGEVKEYFRLVSQLEEGYWIDNVVLPIHLSLARLPISEGSHQPLQYIVGRGSVFRQCDEYIDGHFPEATLMAVQDIESAFQEIKSEKRGNYAVIESEELVKEFGFELIEREVVSHNRTRFAVIGKNLAPSTGYDATAMITRPLRDRVGMLADILGEFTRRGINILDLQSENDIKTQKLRIYIEVEGHIANRSMREAVERLERVVIQESDSLKVLGSFPRVDMRVKKIKSFGFIGSGAMSTWFADRLQNEGYETYITGRSTELRPEDMIDKVDVVMICVPISVTAATIAQYGKMLRGGQALIILAGESENTLQTAMDTTDPAVEIMFVHNLWGPQAISMKDKNAIIVRTPRSGSFCSEFEAFMYKHGADIYQDSPRKHDLLMGVGQKLPTTISVALAKTLSQHNIDCEDISSHSTLTSIYGILAMARVHNQNPRTYAEIMATKGDGRKIVQSFAKNLLEIVKLAEEGKIQEISDMMEENRQFMTPQFLQSRMKQAKAVDNVLSDGGLKIDL
ncbi:prephenate dehydratase domain-containing protein [Desulfopila aestuarii]|uniref:Prephenate dehydrogenase n=1 Tax=Desulfopila aestuarii DSM 18488 TaxID=1121416 RepID=A0A1M7Y0Z1_9BACT|nr:prephenate dehydratase domain-containing protein [Desulfopila aestuarii]SHO45327.1 Prephenate dehydratase [Desulfopila aestuarii DSM 18488]